MLMDYMRTVNLVDTGSTSRTGNVYAPYTPKFFYEPIPNVTDAQYKRYDRKAFSRCACAYRFCDALEFQRQVRIDE